MINRPKTGLAAWESTVGYLAANHSPDALLTLRAYPEGEDSHWSALLEWGANREEVNGHATLPAVLNELWQVVDQGRVIFSSSAEAVRKPAGYGEFDWLDADTKDAIERLMWVIRVVFKDDWTMVILYQATDNPAVRAQARLIARAGDVYINGRGASVRDAVTQLYRNATPYFSGTKD